MWEKDIRHYLKEIHRVLGPGGSVYATCFVLKPEIIERARATNLTQFNLRFEHQIDDNCFISDAVPPAWLDRLYAR